MRVEINDFLFLLFHFLEIFTGRIEVVVYLAQCSDRNTSILTTEEIAKSKLSEMEIWLECIWKLGTINLRNANHFDVNIKH